MVFQILSGVRSTHAYKCKLFNYAHRLHNYIHLLGWGGEDDELFKRTVKVRKDYHRLTCDFIPLPIVTLFTTVISLHNKQCI